MDNPLIFVAVIAVVIVLVMLVPRWIRRSTRSAAAREQQRMEGPRVAEAMEELGSVLVIDASEPVVREIVDAVAIAQPRRFTVLSDGGYGIRFIEPDDVIVRLVDSPLGTRLQVEQFREYMGMPSGSAFWRDLRTRTSAALTSRGIRIDEIEGLSRFHRDDGDTALWSLTEEA